MSAGKKTVVRWRHLTGTVGVSADRARFLQIGLLNWSSRRRSRSSARRSAADPRVTATALVQVNQTGGYAINSWVTSFG